MILATSNKSRQVLCITYIGTITPGELQAGRDELKALVDELKPGFRLLVDLSHLESMGLECRTEVGANMDMISAAGVGRIVRIIPDPAKDMGLNILAFFHYRKHPQLLTCESLPVGWEKLMA